MPPSLALALPGAFPLRARSLYCRAAARHGHGRHCQLPTTALPLCCAMPCCSLHPPLPSPFPPHAEPPGHAVSPVQFAAAAELAAPLCPLASMLHRSPLTVAHPCTAHAAPLDLLDRRHWPLLLPAVGAAAVATTATMVAPPQATSDQAGQPSVCARDPWSSPPLHRRHRRPQPAGAASRPLLCSTVGRKKQRDHAHE